MKLNFLKITQVLVIFFVAFALGAFSVRATMASPAFTSCLNPQGSILAPLTTGLHGIAGRDAQNGTDIVYQVSDLAVTQCFCSDMGQGVQTDWWKIPSMDDPTLASLQSQGWIYIPAGDLWGLDNTPYLAKNTDYTCQGTTTAVVESATAQSSNDGSHSSSSNSSSTNSSPAIFQLANTGNIVFIYSIFAIGLLSLTAGLFLYFRKNS